MSNVEDTTSSAELHYLTFLEAFSPKCLFIPDAVLDTHDSESLA